MPKVYWYNHNPVEKTGTKAQAGRLWLRFSIVGIGWIRENEPTQPLDLSQFVSRVAQDCSSDAERNTFNRFKPSFEQMIATSAGDIVCIEVKGVVYAGKLRISNGTLWHYQQPSPSVDQTGAHVYAHVDQFLPIGSVDMYQPLPIRRAVNLVTQQADRITAALSHAQQLVIDQNRAAK